MKTLLLLIFYVDDRILSRNQTGLLNKVKLDLGQRYVMNDLGELGNFSGDSTKGRHGSISVSIARLIID